MAEMLHVDEKGRKFFRYILEIDCHVSAGDFVYYAGRAIRGVTDNGTYTPLRCEWWQAPLDIEEEAVRLGTGHYQYGETQQEDGKLKKIVKLRVPAVFDEDPNYIIDIANIPDHPPIHVPDSDVPLPESVLHDIRVCQWCREHPMMRNELAKLAYTDI